MVPQSFLGFFQSSVEAGGALVGLLFVAVTIAPEQTLTQTPPIVRREVTASTFTSLANAFFVSLVALLPFVNLGAISLVMGALALAATVLLGRQVLTAPRDWMVSRWRVIPLLVSVGVYAWQLIDGILLLLNPDDTSIVGTVAVLIVVNYAMGMWRAWDLLGGYRFYLLGQAHRPPEGEEHVLTTNPNNRVQGDNRVDSHEYAPQ